MKPAAFEYAAPDTITGVLDLLTQHAEEDVRVLAGGQSLVPIMNFRLSQPDFVVDLRRVEELTRIETDGETLTVGAMVRMTDAEHSPEVARLAPMMREALQQVAHPPIRHSGTVGGSVAHADPAAELPAVMLALEAEIVAVGPGGERSIAAADFFQGPFTTALSPDEILAYVRVRHRAGGQSFVEFARTQGSFALVGVGVDLAVSDGTVDRVAIALSGVGGTPVRVPGAEQVLRGAQPDEATVQRAAATAAAEINPTQDLHGSPAARREITDSYVRRGIYRALERAQNGADSR